VTPSRDDFGARPGAAPGAAYRVGCGIGRGGPAAQGLQCTSALTRPPAGLA
jgi:hypothetical protein